MASARPSHSKCPPAHRLTKSRPQNALPSRLPPSEWVKSTHSKSSDSAEPITHGLQLASAAVKPSGPVRVAKSTPASRDTKVRGAAPAPDGQSRPMDKAAAWAREWATRGPPAPHAATSAEPIRDHEPALVGDPAVRRGADPAVGGAFALSVRAAASRPAPPHGPLPGRARPRHLALARALLRLRVARHRQLGGRPAHRALEQAVRARAGGQADRPGDPADDRRRFPVGRPRGPWPLATDRGVRPAVRLQPSVHVRLRQLRSVD